MTNNINLLFINGGDFVLMIDDNDITIGIVRVGCLILFFMIMELINGYFPIDPEDKDKRNK